jgi:hypothetical protein
MVQAGPAASHSQRRKTRRSSGSASNHFRVGHQLQNRKALGIDISAKVLALADDMIE